MNTFQKSLTSRGLTQRQAEVTEAALTGKTNKQIAEHLQLKVPTVKFHLFNVFKNFNIHNRIGLSNMLMMEYVEFKRTNVEAPTTVE